MNEWRMTRRWSQSWKIVLFDYKIVYFHPAIKRILGMWQAPDIYLRLRYSKCHTFVFWGFRDMDRRNKRLTFSIFPKKIEPFTNILQMPKNVVWVSPVKWGTNFSIYHNLNLNWHTIEYNTSLESLCFHLYEHV